MQLFKVTDYSPKLILSFITVIIGSACNLDIDPPPVGPPYGFNFVKSPAQAVLTSGDASDNDMPVFITDPSVIKDSSGYHLFITNQFCDLNDNGILEESEFSFDPTTGTGTLFCVFEGRGMGTTLYAHSADQGQTWTVRKTPVIQAGPAQWDNEKIETPFVFVHNDTLYLTYCATGDREGNLFKQRFQIGVASLNLNGRTIKDALLTDLDNFTKLNGGSQPLLAFNTTTSDYDNNLQEPSVVVKDGKFELYYTGLQLSDPSLDLTPGNGNNLTGIGLFRQTFDENWNPIGGPIAAFNPLPFLLGQEPFDIQPLNIGEVHFYNNHYHIFYTTLESDADFHRGERIAHAISDDGVNWYGKEVIITGEANESAFDGWGIMAPTVIFEDNEAVLFYTAWGDTQSNECVMFGPGAKWGQNVANSTKCVHGNLGRAVSPLN